LVLPASQLSATQPPPTLQSPRTPTSNPTNANSRTNPSNTISQAPTSTQLPTLVVNTSSTLSVNPSIDFSSLTKTSFSPFTPASTKTRDPNDTSPTASSIEPEEKIPPIVNPGIVPCSSGCVKITIRLLAPFENLVEGQSNQLATQILSILPEELAKSAALENPGRLKATKIYTTELSAGSEISKRSETPSGNFYFVDLDLNKDRDVTDYVRGLNSDSNKIKDSLTGVKPSEVPSNSLLQLVDPTYIEINLAYLLSYGSKFSPNDPSTILGPYEGLEKGKYSLIATLSFVFCLEWNEFFPEYSSIVSIVDLQPLAYPLNIPQSKYSMKGALTKSRRFHILGVGSLGSLLAHHLLRNGNQVTLLFKDEATLGRFKQSKERIGLIESYKVPANTNNDIRNPFRSVRYEHTPSYTFFEKSNSSKSKLEYPNNPSYIQECSTCIENLIITTKAHQTLDAISPVIPKLGPSSIIVLIQNGAGVVEELKSMFAYEKTSFIPQIVLCTTTHGVMATDTPFVYDHNGFGSIFLSAYPVDSDLRSDKNTNFEQRTRECMSDLLNLDLNVQKVDYSTLVEKILMKLSINSIINPISAIKKCRNGKVLQVADEICPNLVSNMCQENSLIISAIFKGVQPAWSTPENLFRSVFEVSRLTASNRSSMLTDVLNNAQTEIGYINGYFMKVAKHHNIEPKYNKMLHQMILDIQS
ncbi:hypothetical protein BB560_001195, partial [Smittium megazygosporum]